MISEISRIAIVGPESTGKSTLSEGLAKHFNTVWVPEYAREYINQLNRSYTYDDLLVIAKKQMDSEDVLSKKANKIFFCDTNLLVTKIWSQHKYNKVDLWIEEQMQKRKYDLHLLCDIDFPWEDDVQREHPHMRKYFFDWYKKELETSGAEFKIVSGVGADRLKNTIDFINSTLSKFLWRRQGNR
jgi:NadR type nicotinamide-nucleotide adenylyltransferase